MAYVTKLSNFLMNNHDKQELTAVPDWKQFEAVVFGLFAGQVDCWRLFSKHVGCFLVFHKKEVLHEDPFADSTEYYSNNYWKLTSDEELPDLL